MTCHSEWTSWSATASSSTCPSAPRSAVTSGTDWVERVGGGAAHEERRVWLWGWRQEKAECKTESEYFLRHAVIKALSDLVCVCHGYNPPQGDDLKMSRRPKDVKDSAGRKKNTHTQNTRFIPLVNLHCTEKFSLCIYCFFSFMIDFFSPQQFCQSWSLTKCKIVAICFIMQESARNTCFFNQFLSLTTSTQHPLRLSVWFSVFYKIYI